ncbi:MAG: tellurite resistance TerB family protein [Gammaproteobacteria bacterium]|nr:tellurite resistance TerB family protein [Gammaproteobacteria bacterium]
MDAKQLLAKFMSNPAASGLAGGALGGGLVAALSSKKGRKMLGGAAQVGGLAALGGLAYHAWNRYQQGQGDAIPAGQPDAPVVDTARQRFIPAPEQTDTQQRLSRNLIAAMIVSARADGAIDDQEWTRIEGRMAEFGLGDDERDLVMDWMRQPAEASRIAALAQNSEEAAELYLASLLAIDKDHWTEQRYLEQLREQLEIPPEFATELERAAAGGAARAAA